MRNDYPYYQLKGLGKTLMRTLLALLLFVGSSTLSAKESSLLETQQKLELKGTVKDSKGELLPGVAVVISKSTIGVMTDDEGKFTIPLKTKRETIIFSMLGFKTQEIVLDGRDGSGDLNIIMEDDLQELDGEVVVVGFGTQKKESMVSAITTINVKELKGPTSNLTTMLAGRISGVIAYQRSGEPGNDNADFFIRGVGSFGSGKQDPLILIDGIESESRDLARLQPDDMAAFSVLKDATAAAVYGARGANGVILVTTKGGVAGKTKFAFRIENSISGNTDNFKYADNVTYMQLANEAALTRNPLASLAYTQSKIDHTIAGDDPYLYPSNNWIDQLIKPTTMNQRYNLNISGGGAIAKFYIAGTYNVDNGLLKTLENEANGLSNNINLKNYSLRTNTTVQLTPTTEAIVRVYGQFDDYTGPRGGGAQVFQRALNSNPVAFPAIYPSSYAPFKKHPLFGNAKVPGKGNLYTNPYALMVSDYRQSSRANIQAQIELKQNLDVITPGLSARFMGYTERNSYFELSRHFNPYYYQATRYEGVTTMIPLSDGISSTSVGTPGSAFLEYDGQNRAVDNAYYGEGAANYARTFNDKHEVGGMLITTIREFVNGNAGNLEASLPYRNMGISGRFTYGYDKRYMIEGNFGYNGSERFSKKNRFGFFPSIGGGWNVSNEAFFAPVKKTLTNLKFRGSYGLVGNDQIGGGRFIYISQVNMNDGGKAASFGNSYDDYNALRWRDGISIGRYENPEIGWEESRQLNLGFEVSAFDLNVIVDYYKQKRSGIYMGRAYIPGTLGLPNGVGVDANVGKAESSGVDVALEYNKHFDNGMWTQLRANLTYATSKKTVLEEVPFPANEWYRSQVGHSNTQAYGLIAERLFVDEVEVKNSPIQEFGEYKAGDIKYRDVNGDGKINDNDKVAIGFPTTPEIMFGFGGTIGYKQVDFSFFVQGSARSSFFINPWAIAPFVNSQGDGDQSGLLSAIAEDHWTEDNRNIYAFWPRMSPYQINNNNQTSTWWLRDGAFMRLKSLEVGYNMSAKPLAKLGLSNLRVYLNANNLFLISKFKMWDPEMGGNGLNYPVQRVYNMGVSFTI